MSAQRSVLVFVVAAVVIAAVGGGLLGYRAGARSGDATPPPACALDDLTAKFSGGEGAMGTKVIHFTLESDRTCHLTSVAITLDRPTWIWERSMWWGSEILTPSSAVAVTLQVWSDVDDPIDCTGDLSVGVLLPEQSESQLLPIRGLKALSCHTISIGVSGPSPLTDVEV